MKRSLVIGAAGQDGSILSAQLECLGHQVSRIGRPGAAAPVVGVDLSDPSAVTALMAEVQPDHVFYLAAFHGSAEAQRTESIPVHLRRSLSVHVEAWANVLEAASTRAPAARLFYAASSHVFGWPLASPQDEDTPFRPTSLYGITKAAGVELGRLYRRRGLHVSSGILFNHESPLRPADFLSTRVCRGAAAARAAVDAGRPYELRLGSLADRVDWGYAPDYTDAMRRVLELPQPGDFVVATGVLHSVEDFCRLAFAAVGLDWRAHVRLEPRLLEERPVLAGNASRLRRDTGWRPSVTFEELVVKLVHAAQRDGKRS